MKAAIVGNLFDQAYEVVNRASERTRSVYYIFLIVNFALFLAAYSTEVYRRPGERVDDFLKASLCVQSPGQETVEKIGTISCPSAVVKAKAWGYDLEALKALEGPDSSSDSWFKNIVKQRTQELIHQDVDSRRVQIPIIGFFFDVDLLWILTSYFGPMGMLIILSSLRVELDLIDIVRIDKLAGEAYEQNVKLRLLLSTQVLLGKATDKSSYIERNTQRWKSFFMHSIFFLPILTQSLEIYNDFDLRHLLRLELTKFGLYFGEELLRHPAMECIKIGVEIFSMSLMIALFVRFAATTSSLQTVYKHLQGRLDTLPMRTEQTPTVQG